MKIAFRFRRQLAWLGSGAFALSAGSIGIETGVVLASAGGGEPDFGSLVILPGSVSPLGIRHNSGHLRCVRNSKEQPWVKRVVGVEVAFGSL